MLSWLGVYDHGNSDSDGTSGLTSSAPAFATSIRHDTRTQEKGRRKIHSYCASKEEDDPKRSTVDLPVHHHCLSDIGTMLVVLK